jgi:hypothetical protein
MYDGNAAGGDLTQSARIIGAALLLAFGFTIPVVMSNRKGRKPSRRYRGVCRDGTTTPIPTSVRQHLPSRTVHPEAPSRQKPQ